MESPNNVAEPSGTARSEEREGGSRTRITYDNQSVGIFIMCVGWWRCPGGPGGPDGETMGRARGPLLPSCYELFLRGLFRWFIEFSEVIDEKKIRPDIYSEVWYGIANIVFDSSAALVCALI